MRGAVAFLHMRSRVRVPPISRASTEVPEPSTTHTHLNLMSRTVTL